MFKRKVGFPVRPASTTSDYLDQRIVAAFFTFLIFLELQTLDRIDRLHKNENSLFTFQKIFDQSFDKKSETHGKQGSPLHKSQNETASNRINCHGRRRARKNCCAGFLFSKPAKSPIEIQMKQHFFIGIFTAALVLTGLSVGYLSHHLGNHADTLDLSSTSPGVYDRQTMEKSDENAVATFRDLVSEIENGKSKINSVEEFLKVLPNSLKANYTLVYNSRSLQQGSFENPRALVYSALGSVVYSFNGDPKQQGFDSIESMIFNKEKKTFEFREIKFASEGNIRTHVSSPEQSLQNNCMGCHGIGDHPLHPIWDAYFVWPGVYGSIDDTIYRDFGKIEDKSIEYQKYQEFLQSAKTHPRYSQLRPQLKKVPQKILDDAIEPGQFRGYYQVGNRINLALNVVFNDQLMQMIARQLASNDYLREHMEDFVDSLAVSGGHTSPGLGVFKSIPKDHFQKNYDSLTKLVQTSYDSRMRRQALLLKDEKNPFRETDELQNAEFGNDIAWSRLITLLEPTGIDARLWSMDLYPRSYQISAGGNLDFEIKNLIHYLTQEICGKDITGKPDTVFASLYSGYEARIDFPDGLQEKQINEIKACLPKYRTKNP